MQQSDDFLEANTARLVEASMGGEARLDPQLRQAMRQHLISELNARTAIHPFPEKALGLLTIFGLLAIAGTLTQLSQGQMTAFENGLWPILILLLLANLALLPIASVVIVLHRRTHEQTH